MLPLTSFVKQNLLSRQVMLPRKLVPNDIFFTQIVLHSKGKKGKMLLQMTSSLLIFFFKRNQILPDDLEIFDVSCTVLFVTESYCCSCSRNETPYSSWAWFIKSMIFCSARCPDKKCNYNFSSINTTLFFEGQLTQH